MNKCVDCKKNISKGAERCYSCDRKRRTTLGIFDTQGSKNPNYLDGRYLKKYYCNCGKKIHYDSWRYGKGRCQSCATKERYKNHISYSWQTKKENINLRSKEYLRSRIYHVLKGINKSETTMKLIGCNIKFLQEYLEKKFKEGMTWKNYGKWHIDHIRPCASFDLSKHEEQKKCFNYKNLQPLWAKENLKKGKKI